MRGAGAPGKRRGHYQDELLILNNFAQRNSPNSVSSKKALINFVSTKKNGSTFKLDEPVSLRYHDQEKQGSASV